jgi:hypothetical protein
MGDEWKSMRRRKSGAGDALLKRDKAADHASAGEANRRLGRIFFWRALDFRTKPGMPLLAVACLHSTPSIEEFIDLLALINMFVNKLTDH